MKIDNEVHLVLALYSLAYMVTVSLLFFTGCLDVSAFWMAGICAGFVVSIVVFGKFIIRYGHGQISAFVQLPLALFSSGYIVAIGMLHFTGLWNLSEIPAEDLLWIGEGLVISIVILGTIIVRRRHGRGLISVSVRKWRYFVPAAIIFCAWSMVGICDWSIAVFHIPNGDAVPLIGILGFALISAILMPFGKIQDLVERNAEIIAVGR